MILITIAALVALFLKENGVRYVFGLPGGETVELLEAFRAAGITFVLTHHEAQAGFAADVTGQLTGTPGVCLATVGPGAVNLLAGAAGATLERSPVIAITAEVDPRTQTRVTHMQLNLNRLFNPAVKSSISLRPETAWQDLHTAWQIATTPPFGAVHISISPDTASATVDNPPAQIKISSPPAFDPTDLEAAYTVLKTAKNLWILTGLGVEMASAQPALRHLAEAWRAPVAVTPKAKGHFPENHPLFAGCFTAYGDGALRAALDEADLILGVGLDGVDFVTSTWEIKTPLLNINCGGAADPVTRPFLAIDGDMPVILAHLADIRPPNPTGESQASQIRAEIRAALETGAKERQGAVRLLPLITSLRTALPLDGVTTVDVGVFKLVFLQAWEAVLPKTIFVANGLSAMGYAIPGAIAIKLAQPQKPVVAIVGDGALHMYTGELGTVARVGGPLIVLVVVDQALALIRLKQLRKDLPVIGTEFQPTHYMALAAAYGLEYLRIDSEESAPEIFKQALKSSRPVLVEARIDIQEYNHFL